MNPNTYSSDLIDLAKKSGLDGISCHSLRHSHATMLLRNNVHPKVVSERLGHSNIGITMDLYSHVMPGLQQEAAQKVEFALRPALDKQEASRRLV
jgi:integrase